MKISDDKTENMEISGDEKDVLIQEMKSSIIENSATTDEKTENPMQKMEITLSTCKKHSSFSIFI